MVWQITDETADRLTNLRFADDVSLMGTGLEQVKYMFADLMAAAKKK